MEFTESTARVFYFLNRFFVDIMVYGTVVMAVARIVSIRDTPDLKWFMQMFGIIGFLGTIASFY